jgi:hypothetical protein
MCNSYSHYVKDNGFCIQPLKCHLCLDKIVQQNLKSFTDFVLDKSLPEHITTLTIEIPSFKENVFNYFNFDGVDTIVYNLFKQTDRSIVHDLRNGDVLLKISYSKDDFFVIPKLVLKITFLKQLLPETINEIRMKIKTTLLVYTLGFGQISETKIDNIKDLMDCFRDDLQVGIDLFSNTTNHILNSISNQNIDEMNFFLFNPLLKVKIREVVNNPLMSLFNEKKWINKWV